MKKITKLFIITLSFTVFSCQENSNKSTEKASQSADKTAKSIMSDAQMKAMQHMDDKRFSLGLNAMQKQHQLSNMRAHLQAVQDIVFLLAEDEYDQASAVAQKELGSSTEMKLMCASFGNKDFENLGLSFHQSADEMSEVFKTHNKQKSLEALSETMNYCVQCHAGFKQ